MPEALSGLLQNLSYTLQKVGSCKIRCVDSNDWKYKAAILSAT